MADHIVLILFGLFACLMIWLNVHQRRRRAKLTTEQRAAEDEENRVFGNGW